MPLALPSQNDLARKLKALHVPGDPLILTNVHDAATAHRIASLPGTKALATASFSIAATIGVADDDLTLDDNLHGTANVARGIKNAAKENELPLTADLQDAYDDPADTVRRAIELGVVGANVEDVDNTADPVRLRGVAEQVGRITVALTAAREAGVPDFVVNARTDVFGFDGTVDDVVERGKAFLEAGATTVFVWGVGKKVISEEEIKEMVRRLDGRLAVQPGGLGMGVVRKLGVSRVSVGPMLWRKGMEVMEGEARGLLEEGS